MLRFLRSLPFAAEFAIVVTLAFGLFVPTSLWHALSYNVPAYQNLQKLVGLVVVELVIMALLFPFLRIRGWSFAKIGLRPDLRDTGIGVLLFIATYAAWIVALGLMVFVAPQIASHILAIRVVTQHVPPALVLAVGLVNPFFEEIFVCGYLMTALKRGDGSSLAINTSVGVRLLYHLYQGPRGVLSVVPLGLIFSFWYARTGRLWPLIVAHSIFDLLALAAAR